MGCQICTIVKKRENLLVISQLMLVNLKYITKITQAAKQYTSNTHNNNSNRQSQHCAQGTETAN